MKDVAAEVDAAITVTANGRRVQLAGGGTVADLLREMGMAGKRVAVECNADLVPRSRWAGTALSDGDRLEIVRAVGGG